MDGRAKVAGVQGGDEHLRVALGSWRRGKTYLELADELVEYVTWQGFTHVELMPVTEHPFEPSWGYQVTNYFAPMSRLGRPDEFRYLVDRLHQAGIGVILDWVPGHFPKDEWALGRFDGTALYEHSDPARVASGRGTYTQLRPQRGSPSWSPTRCTGSEFHTTPAGRGRVHALPRLLA